MPLTVASLCEMTEPAMVPVAGLRGLENRVSWVVSTEHLEPRRWLRGGEFMLMCGWNFRPSRAMIEQYVEHLYSAGLAGLGFGVGVCFKEIPDFVIGKADKLGFPVCLVPYELAFEAISRIGIEFLFAERQSRLTAGEVFKSRTVEEVLEEKIDLRDIATRLANTLLCDATFIDRGDGSITKAVGHMATNDRNSRDPMKSERPVSSSVKLEIHRDEATLSEADKAFVEEMAFAARVLLYKNEAVRRERLRLESDFIQDLSSGSLTANQIASKLSAFGFDSTKRLSFIVVRDPVHPNSTADKVRAMTDKSGVKYLMSRREMSIELLICRSLIPTSESCEKLGTQIAKALPSVSVGVSHPSGHTQLAYALQQARYLSRMGGRGVFYPEMLGIDELIMLVDPQAATDFVRRNIGKNIDSELLNAISVLFECGFNINTAAKKLGIHRHTMRSKLERFAELSNCDMRDPVKRQAAWIAIKLSRGRNIVLGD